MVEAKRSFGRTFLLAWAGFALLSAAWTFATPIGAAPDEPAHLIRAASVATGQVAPFLTNRSDVTVPQYIFDAQRVTCFAVVPDATPTCVKPESKPPTATATVYASSGRYDPLYYALVGWPSLVFHTDAGIYAMRVVADLLMTVFLGLSFALISRWRSPTLPTIGLAVAVTPMVAFLGGVVNPNSLEITATLATFVGMLSIVREPARDLLAQRAAIVFVSASVAANMRGLSLVWVALAILAPLLLTTRAQLRDLLRTRPVRWAIAGCAVLFAAALAWMLVANPLGVNEPGATGTLEPIGVGTSHLLGFLWTFFSTFYYGQQVVGFFGWLAVPAPASVYFAWSLLVGALALVAAILLRRRTLLFAGVLVAALLLLPAILQGIYVTTGGVIWQGRYILPVFACTVVGLAAVLSDRLPLPASVSRRLVPVVLGLWAAAQFLAFATTLKRYAVGTSSQWPAILHPVWSPPGGVFVWFAVAAVVVAAIAAAVSVWDRRATASQARWNSSPTSGPASSADSIRETSGSGSDMNTMVVSAESTQPNE